MTNDKTVGEFLSDQIRQEERELIAKWFEAKADAFDQGAINYALQSGESGPNGYSRAANNLREYANNIRAGKHAG